MENRTCKQCGKEFVITDEEIKFMEGKNLELPKRCKECRKENKAKYRRNRKLTNNNAGKDNNKIKYDKENNNNEKALEKNNSKANGNKPDNGKKKENTYRKNMNKEEKTVNSQQVQCNTAPKQNEDTVSVNNSENTNKPNYIVRIAVGALVLLLVAIIAGAFSGLIGF